MASTEAHSPLGSFKLQRLPARLSLQLSHSHSGHFFRTCERFILRRYACRFLMAGGLQSLAGVVAIPHPPPAPLRYALAALEGTTRSCGAAGCESCVGVVGASLPSGRRSVPRVKRGRHPGGHPGEKLRVFGLKWGARRCRPAAKWVCEGAGQNQLDMYWRPRLPTAPEVVLAVLCSPPRQQSLRSRTSRWCMPNNGKAAGMM